jgi:CRP-like cAMP-binding protein
MLPMFHDLDDAAFDELSRHSEVKKLERGDLLCRRGDPSQGLFVLLRGQLKVSEISFDGREVGLRIIKSVEVFGELGVIDNLPRSADIAALTQADVVIIPKGTLLKVFTDSPVAAFGMLKHLSAMVRKLSQHQSVLSLPSASQRVCAVLIEMTGSSDDVGSVTIDAPRQRALALMANTSRETVSRTLRQLKEEGILEKTKNRFTVLFIDELRAHAGLD